MISSNLPMSLNSENEERKIPNTHHKLLKYFSNHLIKNKEIVVATSAESFFAYASAAISTPFLSENSSWYLHPFITSTVILTLNFFLRKHEVAIQDPVRVDHLNKSKRLLRSMLFSLIDNNNRVTIFHEAGHVLLAFMIFRDHEVSIKVTYPDGAKTTYLFENNNMTYTKWGTSLGEKSARALVAGGGPGIELLGVYLSILIAETMTAKYPEVKSHLRVMSLVTLLQLTCYAGLSGSCEEGNDFCTIDKNVNISPTLAIIFMLGSAFLLQAILLLCLKSKKSELNDRSSSEVTRTETEKSSLSSRADDGRTSEVSEEIDLLVVENTVRMTTM